MTTLSWRPRIRLDGGSRPGRVAQLGGVVGALLPCLLMLVVLQIWDVSSGGVNRAVISVLLIQAILTVGLQVFVGNTGVLSFGHAAFMAVGAYTYALFTIPVPTKGILLPNLPEFLAHISLAQPLAIVLAMGAAAAVAVLASPLILRLTGVGAAVISIALLIVVNQFLVNNDVVTRGPQTLSGVPRDDRLLFPGLCLVVAVALAAALKWSRAGLTARALREDELAAQAVGITVFPARLPAYVMSAAITGAGGAVYAMTLTAFSPASFYFAAVIPVVVALVLGGSRSITGALLGSAVFVALEQGVRRIEDGVVVGGVALPDMRGLSQVVLAVLVLAVIAWRPRGLLGDKEVQVELDRNHSKGAHAHADIRH